jgi:hypothetical protein
MKVGDKAFKNAYIMLISNGKFLTRCPVRS